MQPSFTSGSHPRRNRHRRGPGPHSGRSLSELADGQQAVLDRLELPEDMARRLMELGFLPGAPIQAARSAPGGDPRVFRVDGSEIALRSETAACLLIKAEAHTGD